MISVTPVSYAALPPSAPSARSPAVPVAHSAGQAPSPGPSVTAPATGHQQKQTTARQVQRAVDQANIQMAGLNEQISFSYVKQLDQFVVQVTDKNSGELIRQIPSKSFVAEEIAARAFLGTLLDKKA